MQRKLVDLPVMKKCSKCGEEKPANLDQYPQARNRLSSWCRLCTNAQRREMSALKTAQRLENTPAKICANCGLSFKHKYPNTLTCSKFCSHAKKVADSKAQYANVGKEKRQRYKRSRKRSACCRFCHNIFTPKHTRGRCPEWKCQKRYFWAFDLLHVKKQPHRIIVINGFVGSRGTCKICHRDFLADNANSTCCDSIPCLDKWRTELSTERALELRIMRGQSSNSRMYCSFCHMRKLGRSQTCTKPQCLGKEKLRLKFKSACRGVMDRSKERGWDFNYDLFFQHFKSIYGVQSNCLVPKCKRILNYFNTVSVKDDSATFDRWDNSLGYTPDNVRIICHRCNHIKNKFMMPDVHPVIEYMMKKPE